MSTPNPFNFPVVMEASGLQPQSVDSINAQIIQVASSLSPGLTANLPGLLLEDVASTDTVAVSLADQAKVELVNSLTPNGANVFILTQLGELLGIPLQQATNTSVFVIFYGTQGYYVPTGFLVGDGTNTYQVVQGGVIAGDGQSAPLQAVCTSTTAAFVPAANSVNQLLTSFPNTILLNVNNPSIGVAGNSPQSWYSYRASVQQAMLAASVSTPRFIKTMLAQIPGVAPNLVSVQPASGGFRVICNGANPIAMGGAIFASISNPSILQGSAVSTARNIVVDIYDPPNVYPILMVLTPTQTVTVTVNWNTNLPNFTGGGAFASLTQGPIASYISSLPPGVPINLNVLDGIFLTAVSPVIAPQNLTRLVWSIYINSTLTPPASGTQAVLADPESNYTCASSGVTVEQG